MRSVVRLGRVAVKTAVNQVHQRGKLDIPTTWVDADST